VNLIPTHLQLCALGLSAAVPVMLFLFRPFSPGTRFILVAAIVAGVYAGICFFAGEPAASIVSGAFLLSTAIVFWYVIWGLLAFGFTITLLSSIADHSGPVSESEWVKTYTRGDGLAAFANNRLQLLLNANLIQKDGEVIVLTRRGVCVAWIVRLIRRVQGL